MTRELFIIIYSFKVCDRWVHKYYETETSENLWDVVRILEQRNDNDKMIVVKKLKINR